MYLYYSSYCANYVSYHSCKFVRDSAAVIVVMTNFSAPFFCQYCCTVHYMPDLLHAWSIVIAEKLDSMSSEYFVCKS